MIVGTFFHILDIVALIRINMSQGRIYRIGCGAPCKEQQKGGHGNQSAYLKKNELSPATDKSTCLETSFVHFLTLTSEKICLFKKGTGALCQKKVSLREYSERNDGSLVAGLLDCGHIGIDHLVELYRERLLRAR